MKRLATPLLFLLLAACNTLPVGFGEIGDRVPGDSALSIAPDTAVGYARYVPLGAADPLYFGRDTAYCSRVLIRWTIPDTLSLDSIASVDLVLHITDSSSVQFVCRPCSTSWNMYGVSWLMADSSNHWLTPGGDWWSVDMGVETTEADVDSVVVPIIYRTLTDEQRAAVRDNGIILFPLDTGFCRIVSYASGDKGPRIQVHYTDGETQIDYAAGATGLMVDTLRASYAPTDLCIGSGIGFRSQFLFDIDSIPAAATITKAELRFLPKLRHRRADTLTFGAHRLTESFLARGGAARFLDAATATAYYAPADTDTVVSLDVRSLVQFWTTWPDSNHGLILKADPEYAEFFRMRVPRSGPNAPQLRIQYVLPPGDRFR